MNFIGFSYYTQKYFIVQFWVAFARLETINTEFMLNSHLALDKNLIWVYGTRSWKIW